MKCWAIALQGINGVLIGDTVVCVFKGMWVLAVANAAATITLVLYAGLHGGKP
jgi:hypothetical protein